MNRLFILGAALALLCAAPACKQKTSQPAKPTQGGKAVSPTPTKTAAGTTTPTPAEDPKKAPVTDPAEDPKTDPAAQKTPADGKTPEKTTEPVAPRKRIEGPVAKVNGVAIDSKGFYEELDKITKRNKRIPPERLARIEQNILKRLVEKELIAQSVKKAGVDVKDAEIDAAFKEYKKRLQTEEQFKNYLRHGRVTVESIKERLRNKKALEKLIEARGNLKITDEEAQEFYKKNERFYTEKAGVKASHVLLKVAEKATPDQDKAAMAKVKEVQKALKKEDFAEVAKKMSEGPSKTKGGDLGFFGKGQMVKEFEEVAFKMKVGDVSGPVRTRFGYHIIKVTGKREERKKPFDEVKEQIVQSLRNKKFFQERRTLLQDLRKEAKVEEFLPEPPPAARRPSPKKAFAPKKPTAPKALTPNKVIAPKTLTPKKANP